MPLVLTELDMLSQVVLHVQLEALERFRVDAAGFARAATDYERGKRDGARIVVASFAGALGITGPDWYADLRALADASPYASLVRRAGVVTPIAALPPEPPSDPVEPAAAAPEPAAASGYDRIVDVFDPDLAYCQCEGLRPAFPGGQVCRCGHDATRHESPGGDDCLARWTDDEREQMRLALLAGDRSTLWDLERSGSVHTLTPAVHGPDARVPAPTPDQPVEPADASGYDRIVDVFDPDAALCQCGGFRPVFPGGQVCRCGHSESRHYVGNPHDCLARWTDDERERLRMALVMHGADARVPVPTPDQPMFVTDHPFAPTWRSADGAMSSACAHCDRARDDHARTIYDRV